RPTLPGTPDVRGYPPAPPDNNPPPPQPPWKPSPDGSVPPDTANPPPARLFPPESSEPPAVSPPTKPRVSEDTKPNPELPALPVGIPGLAEVKPRVATGLRPSAIDGLDWLQAKGYRTVVHLRRPGEDDTADRRQFEKRGLQFVSLEVSLDPLGHDV